MAVSLNPYKIITKINQINVYFNVDFSIKYDII